MNSGRTVFAQLIEHLPHKEFQKCVVRYRGDRYAKNFSCWDQYLAMTFAQLTYRESLRDIETCLGAVGGKLYHMGFRTSVARSTLADANESRDWRIYADFAQTLIATARRLYARDPMGVELTSKIAHREPRPIGASQVGRDWRLPGAAIFQGGTWGSRKEQGRGVPRNARHCRYEAD
jgi:hypothetical protein